MTIYDITVSDAKGNDISLSTYKGKTMLIVNTAIKWNFTKFLVNKEGEVVGRYAPATKPARIAPVLERLLGKSM